MTPTISRTTGFGPAASMACTRTSVPIGSVPFRWRRTNSSLTMQTGEVEAVSRGVNARPRTSGMPSVSK
jgi:hypothetical protein